MQTFENNGVRNYCLVLSFEAVEQLNHRQRESGQERLAEVDQITRFLLQSLELGATELGIGIELGAERFLALKSNLD